jgi:hypothetical protein
MLEDMTQEKMIIHSRAMLENPMYQYTLEVMEEEIVDKWVKGLTTEMRELAWHQYQMLMLFDRRVKKVLHNASIDVKKAEEASKWKSLN